MVKLFLERLPIQQGVSFVIIQNGLLNAPWESFTF